jgi:N-acetylglutamate synthase-like GNAT family acetyltransferase
VATGPELTVAPAPASAYEAILGLHHQAGWNPSRVDGEVWAAWLSDELVASMQFEEVGGPEILFVRAMVVREDLRGGGIGAAMLTRVVATRVAEWWLECRTERIDFYARHGFALVAAEDLPTAIRSLVRTRSDRPQNFMVRSVQAAR